MRNKNSDIRVSSDLHLLAPCGGSDSLFDSNKNNELPWETSCSRDVIQGRKKFLFESNKINLLDARS